jgi:hypothetical protein
MYESNSIIEDVKLDEGLTGSRQACKTARAIGGRLSLVTQWLQQNGLRNPIFCAGPMSCTDLQRRWKEWTGSNVPKGRMRALEFRAAVKGCKRMFDVPCQRCDMPEAAKARRAWIEKMTADRPALGRETGEWLRAGARRLLSGWSRKGKVDPVYIPSPKGCLEVEAGIGGTLACRYDEEIQHHNQVRSTVVKTCGKFRTVTVQSARTKRILTPVHESAYDYISKFGWIVRGELTSDHLMPIVQDLRDGEEFISGDYEAATDNLNSEAVRIVVDEMARRLEGEERETLLASFEDVYALSRSGKTRWDLKNGSMCGNLCSFVVLCIINKVCHERVLDLIGLAHYNRKVRINGDDIAFCGNDVAYETWRHVTAEVGLVVNEGKTGRSRAMIELNSKTFLVDKKEFIRKRVFGWLRPFIQHADSLLPDVLECASLFRFRTAVRMLVHPYVQEIVGRRPVSLATVPKRWFGFLIKRPWFRRVLVDGVETRDTGTIRQIPMMEGPPLAKGCDSDLMERLIGEMEREESVLFVAEWLGRKVKPPKSKLIPPEPDTRVSRVVYSKGQRVGRRLWMTSVLTRLMNVCPGVFVVDGEGFYNERQKGFTWKVPLLTRHRALPYLRPPEFYYSTQASIDMLGL